jgi:Bacterial conjugation TrbI-like protein
MSSRVLAGLLAAGCLTAAAGGAYIAVRQNVVQPAPLAASPAPAAAPASAPPNSAVTPVSETEAIVSGPSKPKAEAEPTAAPASAPANSVAPVPAPAREMPKAASSPRRAPTPEAAPKPRSISPSASQTGTSVTTERQAPPALPTPRPEPVQEPVRTPEPPPAPPVRQFEEVVLPAASVMGLEVETSLSSERARVEDRVDAKVARDVMADGHVAIPAGSRVIGSVTVVERGGKVKQPARLGVRFHTLVLADGREIPLRTEPIYREGESPGSESARKIGGAAVGGAILGAILGGGKGAMIGGATGAAGGTAVVMAGDRNAATLTPGTVVNACLSAPATIEVEKRDQQ